MKTPKPLKWIQQKIRRSRSAESRPEQIPPSKINEDFFFISPTTTAADNGGFNIEEEGLYEKTTFVCGDIERGRRWSSSEHINR